METPLSLLKALEGAVHALRGYQYGNSDPTLAEEVADACEKALATAKKDDEKIILDADKCRHDHFQIDCQVDRIEDVNPIGFYANMRIVCTECETPFHFIGLPYGLSPTEPRLEVGGLEARMPIGPGRLPIGDFGEARYEMGRRRK